MPWLMPPIAPTPSGVPHHSVCGIVDPGARVQCRGSCSNLRGSASKHQNHSSKQQFVVHQKSNASRLDQFRTPSSIDSGVPSNVTRGYIHVHIGERFPAPGFGLFHQKSAVALGLLQIICHELFYSVAIINSDLSHQPFSKPLPHQDTTIIISCF